MVSASLKRLVALLLIALGCLLPAMQAYAGDRSIRVVIGRDKPDVTALKTYEFSLDRILDQL